MKKWIALMLGLFMLSSVSSLADSIGQLGDRDITIVPPQGYTVSPVETENGVLAFISCEDADAIQFSMSVVYSEKFAGYTLNTETLSAEQYEQMIEKLTSDFDSPEIQILTAEDGSHVILVDEQGAASDYAFLFTIYQGYCAEVDLFKTTGQITEEEIRMARDILSSTRDI